MSPLITRFTSNKIRTLLLLLVATNLSALTKDEWLELVDKTNEYVKFNIRTNDAKEIFQVAIHFLSTSSFLGASNLVEFFEMLLSKLEGSRDVCSFNLADVFAKDVVSSSSNNNGPLQLAFRQLYSSNYEKCFPEMMAIVKDQQWLIDSNVDLYLHKLAQVPETGCIGKEEGENKCLAELGIAVTIEQYASAGLEYLREVAKRNNDEDLLHHVTDNPDGSSYSISRLGSKIFSDLNCSVFSLKSNDATKLGLLLVVATCRPDNVSVEPIWRYIATSLLCERIANKKDMFKLSLHMAQQLGLPIDVE